MYINPSALYNGIGRKKNRFLPFSYLHSSKANYQNNLYLALLLSTFVNINTVFTIFYKQLINFTLAIMETYSITFYLNLVFQFSLCSPL